MNNGVMSNVRVEFPLLRRACCVINTRSGEENTQKDAVDGCRTVHMGIMYALLHYSRVAFTLPPKPEHVSTDVWLFHGVNGLCQI